MAFDPTMIWRPYTRESARRCRRFFGGNRLAPNLWICTTTESMNFYIDESGNTGDLTTDDAALIFGGQPLFSLAAIGIDDEGALEADIKELKSKHRIQLPELKASALYERPEFVLDLVHLIVDREFPYFVEVVDKKYFLATHITSRQLLPSVAGVPEDEQLNYVRNVVADFLYERAPDVFLTFVTSCKFPSDESLRAQLRALLEFSGANGSRESPAVAVYRGAGATLEEYQTAIDKGQKNAYFDFLPIPDQSRRGKSIWVLPNLSSFTNVYARINFYAQGDLSMSRLIHDEHAHFAHILEASKAIMEALHEEEANHYTRYSDFDFRQTASLSFVQSESSVGLQVADVVAGFCMHYAKDLSISRKELPRVAHDAYRWLLRSGDAMRGTGISHVMSTGNVAIVSG